MLQTSPLRFQAITSPKRPINNTLSFAGQVKRTINFDTVWDIFQGKGGLTSIYRESEHCKEVSDKIKSDLLKENFHVKQQLAGDGKYTIIAERGIDPAKNNGLCLQSHMDIVAVSETGNPKDPIEIIRCDELGNPSKQGSYVKAKVAGSDNLGRTAGFDDGMGVALMLAIAKEPSFKDVPLQMIFTVDEENTCAGADSIKAEDIKGQYLINLDAEFFGQVIVGCCGMNIFEVTQPAEITSLKEVNPSEPYQKLTIALDNAKGGHARDVDKGGINAHQEIFKVLKDVKEDIQIAEVKGNGDNDKFNAIPVRSEVSILVPQSKFQDINDHIANKLKAMESRQHQNGGDPNLSLTLTKEATPASNETEILSPEFKERLVNFMTSENTLIGCHSKYEDDSLPYKGDIITSQNLGVLEVKEGNITLGIGLRSNDEEDKKEFSQKTKAELAKLFHFGSDEEEKDLAKLAEIYDRELPPGKFDTSPIWKPDVSSALAKIAQSCYKNPIVGLDKGDEYPKLKVNHGALESAYFADKAEKAGRKLEIISIGPDIVDPHTKVERMRTYSAKQFCTYLANVITEVKENLLDKQK